MQRPFGCYSAADQPGAHLFDGQHRGGGDTACRLIGPRGGRRICAGMLVPPNWCQSGSCVQAVFTHVFAALACGARIFAGTRVQNNRGAGRFQGCRLRPSIYLLVVISAGVDADRALRQLCCDLRRLRATCGCVERGIWAGVGHNVKSYHPQVGNGTVQVVIFLEEIGHLPAVS